MSTSPTRAAIYHRSADILTRPQWFGFLIFCVLSASGWLIETAWPSLMSTASRQCFHYAVMALTVGLFEWKRITRNALQPVQWAKLAVASVLLFGIPSALIEVGRSGVSEASIAASFALLPVAVVLIMPHLDFGGTSESATTRQLAPALIGLAGTLFLLPFALPASLREARFFAVVVLAVLLAASASVWMYRLLIEVSVAEAVVIVCVANALLLFAVSLTTAAHQGSIWVGGLNWQAVAAESLKAICFDLPQIVLLLWLMRDVTPVQLAARMLIIPLVTVLEGYAMLRPEITGRSVFGAVLLIYGAWRLLTGLQRDQEPGLMLH